jgi:hypothetical protein
LVIITYGPLLVVASKKNGYTLVPFYYFIQTKEIMGLGRSIFKSSQNTTKTCYEITPTPS